MQTENSPQIEVAKVAVPPEPVIIDERPVFKVGPTPFATGIKKYEPGELVVWAVPEGWDDTKYGKHWASYGPSTTFIPMNPPAKKVLADHIKLLAEKAKKPPTADDERAAKLEKLVLDLLASQGEAQAEARRAQARHEELMERLIASQESKGKK